MIMLVGYTAFAPIRESISTKATQQYKKTGNGDLKQAEAISNRVGLLNGILAVIPMSIAFFIAKLIWKRHKSLIVGEQSIDTESDNNGSFIYYCQKCGNVFSGPQDLEVDDRLCPSCGQSTILTETTLSKWQNLNENAQERQKQKWKNNYHSQEIKADGVTRNSVNSDKHNDNTKEKLQQIKNYYENGLITAEEYDKKRKELIDSI